MKYYLTVFALLPAPAFAHVGRVGDQVFMAGIAHLTPEGRQTRAKEIKAAIIGYLGHHQIG